MVIPLGDGVEMEFRRVPAGEFLMGSDPKTDPKARDDEQPQRHVHLDEYWIGRFPVTNRQYAVYVSEVRYQPPQFWSDGRIPAGLEEHPVVSVNWEDATVFCVWLSKKSGLKIALPSEAQWEKAARGSDGRIFPWGYQIPSSSLAHFASTTGSTKSVGCFSVLGDSPYGCADMAGNVWEWTDDRYDPNYYRIAPSRNPFGPPKGDNRRVIRGGSHKNIDGSFLRTAYRNWDYPGNWYLHLGFRCVLIKGFSQ